MSAVVIITLLIIMIIFPIVLVSGILIYEYSVDAKLITTEPAIIGPETDDSIEIVPVTEPTPLPLEESFNVWVNEHNRIRADVGQGPVAWNDAIAQGAQEYSTQCKFEHSPQNTRTHNNNILGENLAYGSPYSAYSDKDIVKLWEDEKPLYTHPQTVQEATGAGHYTQIINKNVTEIGCGCSDCDNSKLCVCHYNPIQIGNQPPY